MAGSQIPKQLEAVGRQALRYFMGTCLPTAKENAVKVRIPRLEFDNYLHMHFEEFEFIYAHDEHKKCKYGDTVLIQVLPERMTRLITHKVVDVIYPMGDITDPVTGKKTFFNEYRYREKMINKAYGEHKNAFDYDKAPPRGRLEGIRDFSDKETYIKYYEDPNDPQPYAI